MDADAHQWNLSPERLYIDCWTRAWLRMMLRPEELPRVCNVGIGVGEWDDWLGHWLGAGSALFSLDIDESVVMAFRRRQRRERHPYPATALCMDLFASDIGAFDLVTMVGSTIFETGAPVEAVRAGQRMTRPRGWLFIVILHELGDPMNVLRAFRGTVHQREFLELPGAGFTAVLARRRR